ncbi:MAG: hypothetical protein QGF16_09460, partial [Rhodospirillales bacterium]|nr:hypothetical protein [Rhodospirillales bacterium]
RLISPYTTFDNSSILLGIELWGSGILCSLSALNSDSDISRYPLRRIQGIIVVSDAVQKQEL